ncbi:hypothetical protein BGZ97_012984 [Linnemannia gamsii]|jgi:hypothetical protein|uniref:Uncharacterized protein n=1 Tax=Linnemannia gamsii TaxID=64522 RepID=A0A9P6R1C8_9FUNG|nr:hypothetical protein BGZ97_012984 [Linnemannia gamsii]
MVKTLALLALCATVAVANPIVLVKADLINNSGKTYQLQVDTDNRSCICLKNTQTAKILNRDAADMKLFSTSDCTGNFSQLGKGKTQINAQWVNSVSMGKSGVPSIGPYGCPNYFNR